MRGTSLAVQWLRLCTSNAGSIPGQRIKPPHGMGHAKKSKEKLNQSSQTQKCILHHFIWNFQKRQTHRDRKTNGCPWLGLGVRTDCIRAQTSYEEGVKCSHRTVVTDAQHVGKCDDVQVNKPILKITPKTGTARGK